MLLDEAAGSDRLRSTARSIYQRWTRHLGHTILYQFLGTQRINQSLYVQELAANASPSLELFSESVTLQCSVPGWCSDTQSHMALMPVLTCTDAPAVSRYCMTAELECARQRERRRAVRVGCVSEGASAGGLRERRRAVRVGCMSEGDQCE